MPGRMLWLDTVFTQTIASGGQTVLSLMTGVTKEQTRFDQMTLMRTIIRMTLSALVHDAGEGSCKIAIGIAIASQEAFAAETLPEPSVSGDFPTSGWLYRANYRIHQFAATLPDIHLVEIDKDVRGRRKLMNGEAYLIWDNTTLESTVAVQAIGVIRQLWLVS